MLVYLEALLDEVVEDEEYEEQLGGEQQVVAVLSVLQQLDDLDVLGTEMKQISTSFPPIQTYPDLDLKLSGQKIFGFRF